MKQIIIKIKRYIHLFILLFLLSNVPVFAQDMITYDIFVQQMSEDIVRLREILETLAFSNKLKNLSQEDIDVLFEEFKKTYGDVRSKYLTYSEDLNIGASKEAVEISSFRYTHAYKEVPLSITKKDEIMLNKQLVQPWHTVEWNTVVGLKNKNKYRKIIDVKNSSNKDFHKMISYCLDDAEMQVFDDFFKYFNMRINGMGKVIEANQKIQNYLIRENTSPLDIMEYAFKNGMLPKEKAGVKLTLQALDADVSVGALVKSIREYLTKFGTKIKDVKYYPVASLTRELKAMNLSERSKYVEGLTDLEKGSQTFVRDFEKLDPYSKRYVGKNITKGFWPLAIIGVITTTAYITDVVCENHYNNATIKQRDLAAISKKIENGLATKSEKWVFFTNPISQRFVETDPVYTLNFVRLASEVYQAENLLNEIDARESKQKQEIENKLLDSYQKASDILSKDLKLGTL